jgi:hypothetical protein
MSDDDAAFGDFRGNTRQSFGDILVGKSVKAVTPNPLLVETAGYRVVIGQIAVVAMKGGIEAGDLRQSRKVSEKGTDRGQIMRLMKWSKRCEPLQSRDHAMIDQYGSVIVRPTVDNPVPDSQRPELKFIPEPRAGDQQCGRHIGDVLDGISAIRQRIAIASGGAEPWTAADAVHLTLDLSLQPAIPVERKDLKLHA